ncbi:keratin-associated protein 19-2-like [Penaeus monodon]|uniref:keratin-associated protein 19-2-like n=1 Tax=Penaeus monodon TaxID=6687 RepID=UPI0018A6FAA9|nr:keratin-associated protein 19-2-like [Penaeus monodon]
MNRLAILLLVFQNAKTLQSKPIRGQVISVKSGTQTRHFGLGGMGGYGGFGGYSGYGGYGSYGGYGGYGHGHRYPYGHHHGRS